ncbi:MAG: hypothetical protein Salg2KO_05700 [Salibacteraceae bacterium]
MLVSIITATYNDGEFLRETINSVLNQTYSEWEWIVVNNGSTDSTSEILDSVSDKRIIVKHLRQNVGVSAGRNAAIEIAKGDFLCFLDGDDILPERSIESRILIFEKDEKLEFVDGKVISFIGDVSNVVHTYLPSFKGNPSSELIGLTGSVFRGNTWMLRKVAGKRYKFHEELSHGEELLLYLELCESGLFSYTEEPVLLYRNRNSSAMTNLRGLETGYAQLIQHLKHMDHFSAKQKHAFRLRVRSIMFRSYLKQFQAFKSIVVWIKFSFA